MFQEYESEALLLPLPLLLATVVRKLLIAYGNNFKEIFTVGFTLQNKTFLHVY